MGAGSINFSPEALRHPRRGAEGADKRSMNSGVSFAVLGLVATLVVAGIWFTFANGWPRCHIIHEGGK
jgi:uncharacterized membrane protein (DUF485 family)